MRDSTTPSPYPAGVGVYVRGSTSADLTIDRNKLYSNRFGIWINEGPGHIIRNNIIYDSPYFPKELLNEIYRLLSDNYKSERKQGQTEQQFLYKTRKKAFGDFKEEMWIPEGNITDRSAASQWELSGSKTTLDRAQSMVDDCLYEYKSPNIPENTRRNLDHIIDE